MKPLYLMVILLSLSAGTANAQASRPKVFENFPKQINCSSEKFTQAFTASEGETISITF